MPYIGKEPARVPVTAADIPDDSITAAKILDGVITAADIGANAVNTSELVDDAVTEDKLANAINTAIAANTAKVTNATHTGEVTGATALTIAADAVDGTNIADNAIGNEHIEDDAVGVAELSATGTASSSTYLRGDNSWATVSTFDPDAAVVFNESGADADFRVESDNNTHTLFVEGSSDNVGIGYASPEFPLTVQTDKNCITGTDVDVSEISLKIQNPNNDTDEAVGLGFGISTVTASVGAAIIFERTAGSTAGDMHFATKASGAGSTDNIPIRMTIKDSGELVMGTVANGSNHVELDGAANGEITIGGSGSGQDIRMRFYNSNGQVGRIITEDSGTSFYTTSDYRLKENVDYDWDATTRLKQLKPARFNFIANATKTLDGFLAHEVSNVVPEAISGDKDAMKEIFYTADDVETQGENPTKEVGDFKEYHSTEIDAQGIDPSKLVPLLVKTIQELEARITTLENP